MTSFQPVIYRIGRLEVCPTAHLKGSNLLVFRKPEKDQAKWNELSVASKQAGELAFKAAKLQNFAETRKSYEAMLVHCNECHKVFDDGKHQLTP